MSEDGEPSILEYARFYGLTRDHRSAYALSSLIGKHVVDPVSDESALFEITPGVAPLEPERLLAGKEEVAFLSSILADQLGSVELLDGLLPDTHKTRDLKLEEPLLRSDHRLDMQFFGGRILSDLKNEHLPFEKINDEEDEGLAWPSVYHELRPDAARTSETEKLAVSKDILLYLKDVLRQHEVGELPKFDDHGILYRRSTARDPITPPLLPMSPGMVPYVPSSDVCHLELLSDPTSAGEELREIEESMIRKDALVAGRPLSSGANSDSTSTLVNSDNIGDIYSPLRDLKDPPILPSFKRKRTEDLKVDGPLTPPRLEHPPPWQRKQVSFQEAIFEIIPDLPSPIPNPEETSTDEIDRFLEESVRPIAEQAERRLEQEQLLEADATQRVQVPVMDFSRPLAPWKTLPHPDARGNDKRTLRQMKRDHFDNSFWPLSGKAERSLPWAPFPTGLTKVAVLESLGDDEEFADLVSRPECIEHTTLVWKLDGLRIFDCDDSDTDEIDYGHFPETLDLQSLLRKRKLDLDEEADLSNRSSLNRMNGRGVASLAQPDKEPDLQFSAVDAIEDFMSIRSGEGKRKKLMQSSYFTTDGKISDSEPSDTAATTETSIAIPNVVHKFHRAPPPPPLPQLVVPKDRRSFIISSSFLADRCLFRLIQSLYPTADFIERDFALHATPAATVLLGPPRRPPTNNTLANEADILLSPSTGLITTTLQKIAQRPLPGSTLLSPIFNRILLTAPRYNALFLLITDGKPSAVTAPAFGCLATESNLNSPSLAPLLPLQAFLSTLPLSNPPSVILIPTPAPAGENPLVPLATHIVHLMIIQSLPSESLGSELASHGSNDTDYPILNRQNLPGPIQLRQEETNWEIFLRRAGLNTYAAQAVLASLRPPVLDRRWERLDTGSRSGRNDGNEEKTETMGWGLATFVRMGEEERLRKFEGIIGRGLLERVGGVLDGRW